MIGTGMIHCISLKPFDIDGLIDHGPPAFSLTWMFTDHGAGGRKGISIPDQIYGSFIVAFPDQRNIARNIDMSRA